MGRGSSKVGGASGTWSSIMSRYDGVPDNRVLYSVPDNQLGATYNSLSAGNRSAIGGLLSLTADDVVTLDSMRGNNGSQSRYFRAADGKRYQVIISVAPDGSRVNYSIKQGNRYVMRNGSYANAANSIAMIIR